MFFLAGSISLIADLSYIFADPSVFSVLADRARAYSAAIQMQGDQAPPTEFVLPELIRCVIGFRAGDGAVA